MTQDSSHPAPPPDVSRFDPVESRVEIGGRTWGLLHPPDAEELIDEEAYARDERLPYWADLWPSALVLAEEVAARWPSGQRVLELGCGVGLPSIVAAGCRARVLATDWYPEALAFVEHNAQRADVGLTTLAVDWNEPPPTIDQDGPFDLILGADILYEDRNGEALTKLIPGLIAEDGTLLITDPRRPNAKVLVNALVAAGWSHKQEDRQNPGRIDETGAVVHLHSLRPPGARG